MIVDVIMLSLTINDNLFKMTQNAINTLHESESDIKFNVLLLESNKNSIYMYDKCITIIPEIDFNYNKYMNYGLSISNNEWVVLCNNDLIFYKNWFSEIYKFKDKADSFSSWNSHMNWHERFFQNLDFDYIEGYGISKEITGWCLTTKRKVFDKFTLNETVEFWYSDDVYADSLIEHNIKHILVKNSKIDHLYSKTPLGENHLNYTQNQLDKYLKTKKDKKLK